MSYFTNATYLTLEGHVELEKYRYVYVLITLSVYLLIICSNSVVISVIYTNKALHDPMYIFIAALLCNSLFGAAALFPKLLVDFLSEKQVDSYDGCMFQSHFIHLYAGTEFTLLSAMAYDRYVSICKPLQYAALVKMSTIRRLLFYCWFVPCCETSVGTILMYQLKLCKFKLNRIYCNSGAIVKLSCGDTSAKTYHGMVVFSFAVVPPVSFIFFSYFRIIQVCLKSSKASTCRRKALRTCFPHLLTFTSFTLTSCFEVINNKIELNLPHIVSMIMSVENMVIPPLINPVIYGLKLQEIWSRIKKMVWVQKACIVLKLCELCSQIQTKPESKLNPISYGSHLELIVKLKPASIHIEEASPVCDVSDKR